MAHDASNRKPPLRAGLSAFSPHQQLPNSIHAANGSSQLQHTFREPPKLTPTYFGHDREEVTRMLIQALYDLGYPSAADELTGCSGYKLESPAVSSLKSAICDGRWKDAERLIKQATNASTEDALTTESASNSVLLLSPNANKTELLFSIRRQRFYEELEKRHLHNALVILQKKLTPLNPGHEELHHLSKLLVCGPEALRRGFALCGSAIEARQMLLSALLSRVAPCAMIPEHRLATLFDYVKQNQVHHCYFHTATQPLSLLSDHACDISNFPTHLAHVIDHHADEVWYVDFSHDGTKLVTTGKNDFVCIYEVPSFRLLKTLSGHTGSVAFAAWSPDDTLLLTCSKDNRAKLWNVESGRSLITVKGDREPITSAAFAPDGKSFVLSSLDSTKQLVHWATTGQQLYAFCDDQRMRDCALSPDGKWLVAVTTRRLVLVYDFQTRERRYHLQLNHGDATCVSISKNSKQMLLNMGQEVRLLDIETGETLRRYSIPASDGNPRFIIRSQFGGVGEHFVTSGSEDSKIYIWDKGNGALIRTIQSHETGCVNTVAWSPTNPSMFASVGDDHKLRIWTAPPST